MEILGERPVWSMSGEDMVAALDAAYAEIARLKTYTLHLTAGLDTIGYAKDVGAGTTARFLTFRFRIDAGEARRAVHLANSLPKYPVVADALPDPAGGDPVDDGVLLHPAQAEAIVSALDKLPTTTPADDLAFAERQMVELGRTHGPLDLRKAGVEVRKRLDTDGPEPAENDAYDRETLKLKTADNGVAFNGFLANENAELFRTLIHAHAKPRKTIDGALDPRTRHQRQADALTTILNSSTAVPRSTARQSSTPTAPPPTAPATTADHEPTTAPDCAATREPATTPGATPNDGPVVAPDASTSGEPDGITSHRPAATPDARIDRGPATAPNATADGRPDDAPNASAARAGDVSPDTAAHGGLDAAHETPHDTASGTLAAAALANSRPRGSRAAPGPIPGHGSKPQIIVTIDFNDLKAGIANATGKLIYGEALSAATIRRLACDAHILPVVLGSDSQPLDLGTTVRLATGPMRKALIARDRGCVCCGAPPLYCDAHHVVSWIDGGETKLDNLVLLCKRCHRDLHAGHWNIHITNGTVHVARPTWATPQPIPRNKYRPPTTPPQVTGSAAGTPTRAWPRDTDPPWITPEEAARLNPWGDTDDEPAHTAEDEIAQRHMAEGDIAQHHTAERDADPEPPQQSRPSPDSPADAARFDVWGEPLDAEPVHARPEPDGTIPWQVGVLGLAVRPDVDPEIAHDSPEARDKEPRGNNAA